ncbi:MAG: glycosyltransferase family 2 protein, partial [Erythrobacter sp.]
ILAVTCMRNEAPYCLEWIAHHKAAGFTQFLIFTHDCSDGTDTLLELLPDVTHVSFSVSDGKSPQWHAMKLADNHPQMKQADWAMFFDCDEFVGLEAPLASVSDLIKSVPTDTDAIGLQWRLFGSSGLIDWEPTPTLDRFTKAAPVDLALPAGHFFKSLFRPKQFQKLGVHRPKKKKQNEPKWVLGGTAQAPQNFANDDNRINLFGLAPSTRSAWLNHYSTRSVTEFMIKRDRGLPNRRSKNIDLSYWAERNFNTVDDQSIKHMLPATVDQSSELERINGVSSLLKMAYERHQQIFSNAMKSREAVMMFLHLSLLSGSSAPSHHVIGSHLKRLARATS